MLRHTDTNTTCWWIFLPLSFCSWTHQLLCHSLYAPSSTTGEIRECYIYVAAADQKDFSSLQLLRVNQGWYPHTVRSWAPGEEEEEGGAGSLFWVPIVQCNCKDSFWSPGSRAQRVYREDPGISGCGSEMTQGLMRVLPEGYVCDSWRWSGRTLVWHAFQGIVITWERGAGSFSQRRLCLRSFNAQSLIPITQVPGGWLVERGHVIMTTMICRDIYSFRWCHNECTYACECNKDCSVMMRLT